MDKVVRVLGLLVAVVAFGGCESPTDTNRCGSLLGPVDYDPLCAPATFSVLVTGLVTEGGLPLSAVAVSLEKNGVLGSDVTNAEGRYIVENLGENTESCTGLTLKFMHPDGRSATASVPSGCAVHSVNHKFMPSPTGPSILIDASRGGGAWWFPQVDPFDPNQPHQGKALADRMRSLGFTVLELPRGPFAITPSVLSPHALVIRAGHFQAGYSAADIAAYTGYVSNGGNLLLLTDFQRTRADQLAGVFGVTFDGITRGSRLVDFLPHPITTGVASGVLPYVVGSGIVASPPAAQIFARLTAAGFLDLNDNGIQDTGEPSAPDVMAFMPFGAGQVIFVGDVNVLQSVPQPLTDNILRTFFPSVP